MKFERSFYTSNAKKVDAAEYGGEVEGFEAFEKTYPTGKMSGMVFFGKQSKPVWHFSFPNREAFLKRVMNAAEGWKSHKAYKDEQKAKKQAFVPTVKVGDIFRTSWGYDQTNVDFYQVVNIPSKFYVEVREIAQDLKETGFMSGVTRPLKDQFLEKAPVLRKKVTDGNSIKINSSATGFLMSDEEVKSEQTYYVSWYA